MFDGLTILGLIGAVKQIWKEKTEPTLPANARFDFDKYNEDVMACVPNDVVSKRVRAGYYHTTERKQFDLKKYNDDAKTGMSPDELESRRLSGVYGAVKPNSDRVSPNYSLDGISGNYVLDVERYEYARKKHPEWFGTNYVPYGYGYRIDKSVYRQYM